jgi:hypothetical protein
MRLDIAFVSQNLKTKYNYTLAIFQLADSPRAECRLIKCGLLERSLDDGASSPIIIHVLEVTD